MFNEANVSRSFNVRQDQGINGQFQTPMGCRSFLQGWHDENGKEVNSGRMNLGVVTLTYLGWRCLLMVIKSYSGRFLMNG